MLDLINSLIPNKNPKIVIGAIQSVVELLTNFGHQKLDFLKGFYAEIEKQASSSTATIRTECINFYKEAMKWMGDVVVKNFSKNLKKA